MPGTHGEDGTVDDHHRAAAPPPRVAAALAASTGALTIIAVHPVSE